jgi:hypothetical protein
MSRLVKHFAPLAALTLATVGSTWFLSSSPTRSLPSIAASAKPGTNSGRSPANESSPFIVAHSAGALDLQYRPQAGRRYVYSFQRKITIQGLPQNGAASSEIAYHGQLELDVIKSDSKGFEALTRAHLVEHEIKNPVTLKIQLSSIGDRLSVFGAPLQSEEERQQASVLKDLLSLWGFNLHEDTVGFFDARFETDPLRKRKLSYIESKSNPTPLPSVLESEHFLGWDEYRALPHEISGHETTQMGQSQQSLTASSEYQILLVNDQALPADATRMASLLKDSESLALNSDVQAQTASDLNWQTLLSSLQGLDGMDANAQLRVFGDLARYLRSHPGSSAELVDLLRAQGAIQLGVGSALFKSVLGSLISSGTAEGQSAAIRVYSDPACPVSGKGAILSALTTSQAPLTSSTQDFLASAMSSESNKDLSQGASYALGASLQKTPDGEQKSDLIESLRQTLAQALSKNDGNLSDQLSALDAIGNSGQAAYLPELRALITSSESLAVLRAKAVYALRFIRSNEATNLLTQSLSSSDYQVRQSAARAIALASWTDSFRVPLQNCASSDPLSSIQSICRSTLATSDPKLASN